MSKKDIVFCKGGGCTAKLGPGILSRVLERIPKKYDENLLIGFESSDDASVYKLTDDIANFRFLSAYGRRPIYVWENSRSKCIK